MYIYIYKRQKLHKKGKNQHILFGSRLPPTQCMVQQSEPNNPPLIQIHPKYNLSQPKIWQSKKQLKGLPSDYGKNNFVVDTNR